MARSSWDLIRSDGCGGIWWSWSPPSDFPKLAGNWSDFVKVGRVSSSWSDFVKVGRVSGKLWSDFLKFGQKLVGLMWQRGCFFFLKLLFKSVKSLALFLKCVLPWTGRIFFDVAEGQKYSKGQELDLCFLFFIGRSYFELVRCGMLVRNTQSKSKIRTTVRIWQWRGPFQTRLRLQFERSSPFWK